MGMGKLGFHPEEQYYNQQVLSFELKDDEVAIEYIDEYLLREIGYEVIKTIYETKEPYVIYVERDERDIHEFSDFDSKVIKYNVYIKNLTEHNKEIENATIFGKAQIFYGGMR
jgi:hypothetical protein